MFSSGTRYQLPAWCTATRNKGLLGDAGLDVDIGRGPAGKAE